MLMVRIAPVLALLLSLLLSLLLITPPIVLSRQPEQLPAGKLIERVTCRADSSQAYALYLPSYYSRDRQWPILYGFDPGGRGKLPVELFSEAAEKYGWIVAGSHNSRNGPDVPINTVLSALWQDTHERLAIDDRRVYTTGMSGGARVACSLAISMKSRIAGVIASGAGFPSSRSPDREMRFAFMGIAGVEDFNLIELRLLDESLAKAGVTRELITFDGDHRWPPKEIAAEAVEWMELQAMKSDRRDRDDKLIATLYEQGLARAKAFEASAKPYDAFIRYRLLAGAFKGLRAVDEVSSHTERLRASKDVQTMIGQLKSMDRQQEARTRQIMTLLQSLDSSDTRIQTASELKSLIGDLKKKAEAKSAMVDRTVARRLIAQLFVTMSEQATAEMFRKNYDGAASFLMIAAEIRPNPQVYYRLASAYAQAGEKKRALESLKQAVELGFNDVARLEQAAEFQQLRHEKEFVALTEQIKAK